MRKEIGERSIRERFDAKGFGVNKYARAHGLSQPVLSLILGENEQTTGTHRSRAGVTRRIYMQLKQDGVWIGVLPWEVKK